MPALSSATLGPPGPAAHLGGLAGSRPSVHRRESGHSVQASFPGEARSPDLKFPWAARTLVLSAKVPRAPSLRFPSSSVWSLWAGGSLWV